MKVNDRGSYIYAQPVQGATQYQWRFRACADLGFIQTYTTSNYFLRLGRAVLNTYPQYIVDVRAFKNGAWCVDAAETHWGPNCLPGCGDLCGFSMDDLCLCTLDIVPALTGGSQHMEMEQGSTENVLWPNPNVDGQVWLSISDLEGIAGDERVSTVTVDVFDLFGKRVFTHQLPVQDNQVNTLLTLPADLATGVYSVSLLIGDQVLSERLVIQR